MNIYFSGIRLFILTFYRSFNGRGAHAPQISTSLQETLGLSKSYPYCFDSYIDISDKGVELSFFLICLITFD